MEKNKVGHSIENVINTAITKLKDKEFMVDTASGGIYSLVVGAAVDYSAGLDWKDILYSRGFAIGVNAVMDGPYGKWRNAVFSCTKTTEECGKVRKNMANLLAFNTFQTPGYGVIITVSSLLSNGEFDMEKVEYGMAYLAMISPLIGPTMGMWMDVARSYFGLPSAAKKAAIMENNSF